MITVNGLSVSKICGSYIAAAHAEKMHDLGWKDECKKSELMVHRFWKSVLPNCVSITSIEFSSTVYLSPC